MTSGVHLEYVMAVESAGWKIIGFSTHFSEWRGRRLHGRPLLVLKIRQENVLANDSTNG